MASVTSLEIPRTALHIATTGPQAVEDDAQYHQLLDPTSIPPADYTNLTTNHQPPTPPTTAPQWASLLRTNLHLMTTPNPLNPTCLSAPRRRHINQGDLALHIASLIYPTIPTYSSLSALIKYEKDVPRLRKAIQAQQQTEIEAEREGRLNTNWKMRIRKQGAWDEGGDGWGLEGAPALPMPVVVSDGESLEGFFGRVGRGGGVGGEVGVEKGEGMGKRGEETWYGVQMREFEKGILYEDGRMDLCKMVLGPPNIERLMANLEKNDFVRHFLLGNNMVGPVGARAIAEFVSKHPNKIETWYLAGNCIDNAGLDRLVKAWTTSTAITNIWLKRNPLGPNASTALYKLITKTANLRTLDLDQTKLGDIGIAQLFTQLASHTTELPLRNIYLNATGIGESACKALANYLSSPYCRLESLYISCNPVGDAVALALASGLEKNTSLLRLSITSCGLKNTGAIKLFEALVGHPRLLALNVGQNYASEDLGARYNWLEDGVVPHIVAFVRSCSSLRMLELGTTAMTLTALTELVLEIADVDTLVFFNAQSVYGKLELEVKARINDRIKDNIKRHYGGMDVATFDAEEKRWLISSKDVRLIDSAYRNRDVGLARRGMLRLKKWWDDDLEMVDSVMQVDDSDGESSGTGVSGS